MQRTATRVLCLLAVVAFGFLLVACSDDDDDETSNGQGGGQSAVCSDLEDLQAALTEAETLSSSSTVDEARDARDDVRGALNSLRDSASDAVQDRLNSLDDAYSDLDDAVDDLSGDQTIGQAIASLASQIRTVIQAYTGLSTQVDCP